MSAPHSGGPWQKELQASTVRSLLHGAKVSNKSGAGFWLWVCDASSSGVTDPSACPIYVAANGHAFLDWIGAPRLMENGIYVCASTDPAVKTLIAANDAFFEVAWKEFLL